MSLEAARHADVKRIVYAASGGSRYGDPERTPADECVRTDPISPYAVAKLAGEMYLRAYAEMYGISPICLALANVYGPRQNPHGEAGVITVFGRAMITDNTATVYGDGTAARDYVYVDDVVDAFMRAAEAPHSTVGTFNIGTGRTNDRYRSASADRRSPRELFVAILRGGAQRRIAGDRTGFDQGPG